MEVIGPRIDLDRLTTSIEVEIADRIGSSWDEWFGLLSDSKRVKVTAACLDSMSKGRSVLGLGSVSSAIIETPCPLNAGSGLDEIGFVWDTLESAWEEGFAALTKFKAREGHCRVPAGYVEGTFKLGQWVGVQRTKQRQNVC